MYFPSDMNFQYFFFSTYPGFFLQGAPYCPDGRNNSMGVILGLGIRLWILLSK